MSFTKAPFFSPDEQKRIIAAIGSAESQTSGEIQVFIESNCPDDVMTRARAVFDELEMYKTALRNGVLFYLAYEDHKFAVLGDSGIHERVSADFWETTKEHLRSHFVKSAFADGFVNGILEAGEQLKKYFPETGDSGNELPNEIVFGK